MMISRELAQFIVDTKNRLAKSEVSADGGSYYLMGPIPVHFDDVAVGEFVHDGVDWVFFTEEDVKP